MASDKPHRKTRKMLKTVGRSSSYQAIVRATLTECAEKGMKWEYARNILAAKIAEVAIYSTKKHRGVLLDLGGGIGVNVGGERSKFAKDGKTDWLYIADQYRGEYESLLHSLKGQVRSNANRRHTDAEHHRAGPCGNSAENYADTAPTVRRTASFNPKRDMLPAFASAETGGEYPLSNAGFKHYLDDYADLHYIVGSKAAVMRELKSRLQPIPGLAIDIDVGDVQDSLEVLR